MNEIKEGDIVTLRAKVLRFYDNGNVRLDFDICEDEGNNLLGIGQMNLPKHLLKSLEPKVEETEHSLENHIEFSKRMIPDILEKVMKKYGYIMMREERVV